MTSKLPDKPSALIRAGLEDLDKIENLPEIYEVDMDTWHEPNPDTRLCGVCLAGGMMAMRFGVRTTEVALPVDPRFSEEQRDKLRALDNLRCGNVTEAFFWMSIDVPEELEDSYEVTSYCGNPTAFKADMRRLADTLEGAGL